MNLSEFMNRVQVIATPEEGHTMFDDGMSPDATFWVHTMGLHSEFGRPELELRNVPALFVPESMRMLNGMGSYSVDNECKLGQKHADPNSPLPVLCVFSESEKSDFWEDVPALWIKPHRIAFTCYCCAQKH